VVISWKRTAAVHTLDLVVSEDGIRKSTNDDTEVLLFKNSKQKLAVFALGGTERKLSDWLKHSKIKLTRVNFPSRRRPRYISVRLHEGFKDRYKDISSWFEAEYQAIPREYKIVVTGHSLEQWPQSLRSMPVEN
jgi:predicted lipase